MRASSLFVRPIAVVIVCAALFGCDAPQDVTSPPRLQLEELVPGFDYASWYSQHTGFPPHPERFAAFDLQPIGETLYLGFGGDLPAWMDGALLGAFDAAGVRAVAALDEQGMLDMAVSGETLLIPGVDPCCPDGWEAGNFYTYHPSVGLTKWRNLPNVFHAWGAWHDTSTDDIYLAVSSHPGDFATSIGEIWRTGDNGASWERIADDQDGVGRFRTYDVTGLSDRLFALSADTFFPCTLVGSPLVGGAWNDITPNGNLACLHRLVPFAGDVIALDTSRTAIHVASPSGGTTRVDLPFAVGEETLNWATVIDPYLYAAADDGRILATRDLADWETLATAAADFSAIEFWPAKGWLVLAERGVEGRLWKLPLCTIESC